mgnify:CR=1 FL=1
MTTQWCNRQKVHCKGVKQQGMQCSVKAKLGVIMRLGMVVDSHPCFGGQGTLLIQTYKSLSQQSDDSWHVEQYQNKPIVITTILKNVATVCSIQLNPALLYHWYTIEQQMALIQIWKCVLTNLLNVLSMYM